MIQNSNFFLFLHFLEETHTCLCGKFGSLTIWFLLFQFQIPVNTQTNQQEIQVLTNQVWHHFNLRVFAKEAETDYYCTFHLRSVFVSLHSFTPQPRLGLSRGWRSRWRWWFESITVTARSPIETTAGRMSLRKYSGCLWIAFVLTIDRQ